VLCFQPFVSVSEQEKPDPDFPTVIFPNPEEGQSALDLALQTADREGCTLILANDPDADRLAAAEQGPG
jgi:phosphomannomutase